jgi:hypothetical protein
MTKNQALQIAAERVKMYRQGRGWIVSHYDPKARAYRTSHEMPYEQARSAMLENRLGEALNALGYNDDDTIYLAVRYSGPDVFGSLRERLNMAVQ